MKQSKAASARYILSAKMSKNHILSTLKKYFMVKATAGVSEKLSLVDSFSWGFYTNDLLAFRDADNNIKIWPADDLFDPDQALTVHADSPQAKFWWDYKATPERTLLKKILDLRALQTLAEGVLKIDNFNLQHEDGKTVVFFQLISFFRTASARIPLLRQAKLTALTGYQNEYQQTVELIEEQGGFVSNLNPVDSFLGAVGVIPNPYSVKPDLTIEAAMPARAVVNAIISQMIEKQRLTEQGILEDIDTEFLHHFRVSIRINRAAVAQLKEVYPEQDVLMLKERFGNLGKETNLLRDLDVFILDKSRYLSLLPKSLADGLLPMFDDFETDRANELKRISRWLSGDAYKKEINELQALFSKGYPAGETLWSERPAIELAVNKLKKRYKKIQKAALKITGDTPDAAIHSIRIDCKKLRYLLNFFGSLFDKKQLKLVEKQLKQLQNTLGIFNDLSVQQDFLENYLEKIEHKKTKDIYLIASLGGLIAILYQMHQLERKKCINELHIFSAEKNRQLFTQTFTVQGIAE